MVKVEKSRKNMLYGHSLVEVVVSTIIILITFLLFSSLLGQLVTENKTSQGIKMLFYINNATLNDTAICRNIYFGSYISLENSNDINDYSFFHVKIKTTLPNKVLYQFYLYKDSANIYID